MGNLENRISQLKADMLELTESVEKNKLVHETISKVFSNVENIDITTKKNMEILINSLKKKKNASVDTV